MASNRRAQRTNMLALLINARGMEVPLPEIMACGAQYNARIHELRKLGFRIPAPRVEVIDGQRHTFYRLELDSGRANTPTNEPAKAAEFPETLFDIQRDRTYAE